MCPSWRGRRQGASEDSPPGRIHTGQGAAPDHSWLASGGKGCEPVARALATGEVKAPFYGIVYELQWLAAVSEELLVGGSPLETVLWDISNDCAVVWRVDHSWAKVQLGTGAVEPTGRWLARACSDGSVRILAISDGSALASLRSRRRRSALVSLAASPFGDWLACGRSDGTIQVWDVRRRKVLADFTAHHGGVSSLAATPDGSQLVSSGPDGRIQLWNLGSP